MRGALLLVGMLRGIVGGADDPSDPAVVAFVEAGYPACTGTLVAPVAVLTAGHCANGIGASTQYEVVFGSDASHPTRRVKVAEQLLHPRYTAMGAPYDFALLRLAEPVLDVAPVVLGAAPLSGADVGAPIRHVGFGVSDEAAGTGRGIKRTATFPITEVDPLIVWSVGLGMQTCLGDSGGPGLVQRDGGEVLVGVVSDGPNCHDAGWDGRVDVARDWIDATLTAWSPGAGPPDAGSAAPPSPKHGGCETGEGMGPLALGVMLALGRRRLRRARP